MSYEHFSAPFRVGDRVEFVDGEHTGRRATVTRRLPGSISRGADAVYFVTFDGEPNEYHRPFLYEQLAAAPPEEMSSSGEDIDYYEA